MQLSKYHALGNDYLVLESDTPPPANCVQHICDRHRGIGADGLLVGNINTLAVRIFNPDGSLAERSGNGLRIFAAHCWRRNPALPNTLTLQTSTGPIACFKDGDTVAADLGPTTTPQLHTITLFQHTYTGYIVHCGNPHYVVFDAPLEQITRDGPMLETHPDFPHKTNVQFVKIRDHNNIQIEIWERGAGYTLSSGTSATAASAVAMHLKHCDENLHVHMTGGTLRVQRQEDGNFRLSGPITYIAAIDIVT